MRKYYAADFELFVTAKNNVRILFKEGMVSPQIPDMCPKAQECDKKPGAPCPYEGCKVPWLDMEIARDYPCIKVGCNPTSERRVGYKPPEPAA